VYSDTVFVVWDMENECEQSAGECTRFTTAYIRSNNNGQNWPTWLGSSSWCEVAGYRWGTDLWYRSTDDSQAAWEYTLYLQPSVALDGRGWPTVVWHANEDAEGGLDYDLKYTYALTVPSGAQYCIDWSTVGPFGQRTSGQSGSPVIALAPVISPHLHVAYLWSGMGYVGQPGGDWETYYDSNEYDTYSHIFLPITLRNFYGGGET